jgi:6-phosphofructokinase
MGVKAVEALMEGKHGVMTGLQGKNMEYHHMTKVLAR